MKLRKTPLAALTLVLLVGLARAALADSDEAERMRVDLRRQATQAATDVLRQHCPDRCQLLAVTAEVDEGQPLAHVQPGFEELSPLVRDVRPRGVDVQVLVDARLPADFRRDLLGLLKARLKAVGAPVTVRTEAVPFPQPPPMVLPPITQPQDKPAPPPAPPEPPDKPAPPPFDPTTAFLQRLIEASPWLLGILLVGLLGVLLLRAVRGPSREDGDDRSDADADDPDAPARPPPPVREPVAGPPLETLTARLATELHDNPRLRTAMFREMLLSGADDKLAACVRLLGPGIAEGLKEDPECRQALRRVSAALRQETTALPEEEARRLLRELDGNLVAAKLETGHGPVEEAFAFLDQLSPAQFRRLVESSSPKAQGAALRFAPSFLREAALEGLAPGRRRALFVATAEARTPGAPELADLADELRLASARLGPGGDVAGLELLGDLLDSQGETEQEALLDSLAARPAVRQALLARLCSEATLAEVGDDVLAAVAGNVELVAFVDFLRGAGPDLKERFLAASPRQIATALREELSLAVTVPPSKFAAARRLVMRAARAALEERGIVLAEINARSSRRATA